MDSLVILQQASAATNGNMGMTSILIQLALLGVVFYFFLIRPQQKRQREHEATINAVQRGDDVVTGGGLMGKVTKVSDDHVEIEIASGVKVKAVKGTLASVTSRTAKPAND